MTGKSASMMILDTDVGELAALRWPKPGAPRVLCLHGWLDNAASFVPLAAELPELDLVALEFAGHGHSCHRPRGMRYHFLDYIWDVEAALNALEWDRCALLGHSLGGAVACCFASASRERILRLALIDGLGPLSASADETASRLRRSMASTRKPPTALRRYDAVSDAVEARRGATPMSEGAARLLVERALVAEGDHFRWRTDPRLNWVSPAPMTEEQVCSILAAIECPVLSVSASPLMRWMTPERARGRLGCIADIHSVTVDGHHHFHMDRPRDVAPHIRDFLTAPE